MKYILCSILLTYYFFTSGICYELFTNYVTDHIESPYNIGLSAERTGIMPVATQDDIDAIKWLKKNTKERIVITDYNGYLLQHGFMQNHVNYQRSTTDLKNVKSGDLVYLTSWNVRNGKYIEAAGGVGVRSAYPLPDFTDLKVLYTSGDSTILEKE